MVDKFHFPEGSGMEVFSAVARQYGIIEREKGRHYEVDEHDLKGSSFLYSLSEGWELMINQYYSDVGVVLEEIPASRDLIVLRFVDGGLEYITGEEAEQKNTSITVRGVTMIRMNKPAKVRLLPKRWVRWVSLRMSRENWERILNINTSALLDMIFNKRGWLIQEPISLRMEDAMAELFALQKDDAMRVGMSFSKGFELLSLFAQSLNSRREEHGEFGVLNMDLDVLLKIKEEWSKNLPSPSSVGEMSAKFGVDAEALSVNFKRAFGMSPQLFLEHERMRYAYRLVCRSEFSFGEISYSLGFGHSADFSQHFKKTFGINPTEARRKYSSKS